MLLGAQAIEGGVGAGDRMALRRNGTQGSGQADDPCTRGAGPCFRIYEFSGVEKVDETAHGHGLPGTEDQMR